MLLIQYSNFAPAYYCRYVNGQESLLDSDIDIDGLRLPRGTVNSCESFEYNAPKFVPLITVDYLKQPDCFEGVNSSCFGIENGTQTYSCQNCNISEYLFQSMLETEPLLEKNFSKIFNRNLYVSTRSEHTASCKYGVEMAWTENIEKRFSASEVFTSYIQVSWTRTSDSISLILFNVVSDQLENACLIRDNEIVPFENIGNAVGQVITDNQYNCTYFSNPKYIKDTYQSLISYSTAPQCVQLNTTTPINEFNCPGNALEYYYDCGSSPHMFLKAANLTTLSLANAGFLLYDKKYKLLDLSIFYNWQAYRYNLCDYLGESEWEERFIVTTEIDGDSPSSYGIGVIVLSHSSWTLSLYQYDALTNRSSVCFVDSMGLVAYENASDFELDFDFTEATYDCEVFFRLQNTTSGALISQSKTPQCVLYNTSTPIGDPLCFSTESDYYYDCNVNDTAQVLFLQSITSLQRDAAFVFHGFSYSISATGPSYHWEAYHHSECVNEHEFFWAEQFSVTVDLGDGSYGIAEQTLLSDNTNSLSLFQYDLDTAAIKYCYLVNNSEMAYQSLPEFTPFIVDFTSQDDYDCGFFFSTQVIPIKSSKYEPVINQSYYPNCREWNSTFSISPLLCYGESQEYYYDCESYSQPIFYGN